MELVGTHQIFGLLRNITQLVGRGKLGRDRRINHIYQHIVLGSKGGLLGQIAHQILNQRLRHTGIHAIHRHVVAIIGGPSECQLREVASAYYQSVILVGQVHEYLRALTSLRIFVGGIVDGSVVVDIMEVLSDGSSNGYLQLLDAQRLHKRSCIIVGAVGSAKAWHRDTDNTLAVESYLIKGTHAHEER